MPIDVLKDELLTVAEVAKRFPGSKGKPHISEKKPSALG